MFKLGIDVGGTKFKLALVDESGNITVSDKYYVDKQKDLSSQLCEKITEFLAQNDISLSDILSCGVGLPGTISDDGRRALKVPNLNIVNDDLAEKIENLLMLPVTLVQDSRAAAYGEYRLGAGKGYKNVICITLGTGIGTGMVADGKIFAGALGCAGEIGHTPVVENGRKCGCGKTGCLECYAAGKGLDISARELLGEGKNGTDLFDAAKAGNEKAKEIIGSAVEMLGKTVVGVVNMLSPDCLVFSGGISTQTELYLEPLVKYIESHVYRAGEKTLKISASALGEDSPVVGAALVPSKSPVRHNTGFELSASVMCADILNAGEELKKIKASGIKYIHCDIMDNHFVPNLMISPDICNTFRKNSDMIFDYHIMTEKPETVVEMLDIREGDMVSVHYESSKHIQRVLSLIKSKGAIPALAINVATPVECIREVLDDIGCLLIMTVNPGFSGQKLVPQTLDKVSRARKYMDELGYKDILIEVDGNCSFENIPKMRNAGADIAVVGTSSVFRPEISISDAVRKIYTLL